MQLRKVRTFRASGRVEVPGGVDPRSWSVHLGPNPASGLPSWMVPADHGEAGFDFRGLLPGSYVLRATCGKGQQTISTQVPLEVTDSDFDGLVVTFPVGFTLAGAVRSADDGARIDPTTVHISLYTQAPGAAYGRTTPEASGAFAIQDLSSGRYQLNVRMPEHGYVQSVRYAGEVVRDGSIEIRAEGALGFLEIVVASGGGEVTGVLQGADGEPLSNHAVRLLTEPPRFDRFGITHTDQNGRFWFRDVAPGSHWIFAVNVVVPAIEVQERWERHEGAAHEVTVHAGGQYDVTLRLPK
ncbi:MAG TPA: carboxypeptidase-like regulatory domain-containing protein [Bryobacteraceae bacterium]|nr:carboxypeptidase-like regulatory domain-containing protein [Bryobacteraceae bacterium]